MSPSVQVKCWQYHDTRGHAVLIGDAAHATAPNIGQGCNASIVDASVLARLLILDSLCPPHCRSNAGSTTTHGGMLFSLETQRTPQAPNIGQGCNASIVDASVLARLLLGNRSAARRAVLPTLHSTRQG